MFVQCYGIVTKRMLQHDWGGHSSAALLLFFQVFHGMLQVPELLPYQQTRFLKSASVFASPF